MIPLILYVGGFVMLFNHIRITTKNITGTFIGLEDGIIKYKPDTVDHLLDFEKYMLTKNGYCYCLYEDVERIK